MKVFVVSLAAAITMMAALASSSSARTDSHFPEGIQGGATACEVLLTNEAANSNPPVMPDAAKNPPNQAGFDGSDNGFFNKVDLFADACLGA